MTSRRLGLAAAVVVVGVGSVGVWMATSRGGETTAAPHQGRFVVECLYSHSAPDDPIVFPGDPGASHRHDFFGAVTTDAFSTVESLETGDTTCRTRQDTAAYWAPALFDGDRQVEPLSSDAYYRAAPGVDPGDVEPFPTGLMMISGDATSTAAQPTEHVGWTCANGGVRQSSPPACGGSLTLRVTFPDCWDGQHLDSVDHRAHVARSGADGCPGSHPVAMPQLEFVVQYPFSGDPAPLHLASGSVITAHADFVNAWDPDKLASEVHLCIQGDVVCGVPTLRGPGTVVAGTALGET